MYAKGMSQRDIADTIEDLYGFNISHETISEITDKVIERLEEWQNRPLKKFYTFLFVDCMYVSIKKDDCHQSSTQVCAFLLLRQYARGFSLFRVTGFTPCQVRRFFWSSTRLAFFDSFSYGTTRTRTSTPFSQNTGKKILCGSFFWKHVLFFQK